MFVTSAHITISQPFIITKPEFLYILCRNAQSEHMEETVCDTWKRLQMSKCLMCEINEMILVEFCTEIPH